MPSPTASSRRPHAGVPLLARVLTLAVLAGLVFPSTGDAQIVKKLKKAAKGAVERETENQIDRLVSNAIKCVFDDPVCVREAKASGQDVVLTDDEGNVLTDHEGAPITDPEEAEKAVQADGPVRPGEGVWANYDFVPGERVLFFDDYSGDNVGDFPRRFRFLRGNWEIVEWQGRRLLRNTGPRGAALEVPLPEALPERFTIEFDAYFTHPNHQLIVGTEPPEPGKQYQSLSGNFFQVAADQGSGVTTRDRAGVKSLNKTKDVSDHIVPFRIMVDDQYAKVYVGSERVANVPNAELARGQALYLENSYSASDKNPMYIGPIRVAAGGRDLYDVLAEEGRVVTHGILFAVNSDRIRPESTPTLESIAGMLRDHPELRLSIEGHTDSDGDDAYNQDLSRRRAAAVKAYLVESEGIDEARLETTGFGESKPAADNSTPEGKQQNRRVELVRLGAGSPAGASSLEAGGEAGSSPATPPGSSSAASGTMPSASSPASRASGSAGPDPARGNTDRFTGVYGDPAEQDGTARNVFVSRTCDGHLQFGATWGDVAPWVMKPLSDTEFEQAVLGPYDTEPIRLSFEVGSDGRAAAVTHNLTPGHRMERLVRLGDLAGRLRAVECEGTR